MVELYFDKEFIITFEAREDKDNYIIQDFFHELIRKIRGVNVYVNLSSIEELIDLIQNSEFYALLNEINSPKLLDFISQLSNKKFYDGFPSKVFFVENVDEELLQKKFGYLFISNESLIKKWRTFINGRDDDELIIKSSPMPDEIGIFRSWSDLYRFQHPLTDMLIFDLYVLSNKSSQKINDNIFPCLRMLINDNEKCINGVTIITKELAQRQTNNLWLESNLKLTHSYLNHLVDKGQSIILIKYDDSKMRGDSEHNRFILTNYFLIRTGAGFNIFKESGYVNNRDTIKFDSILKNKTRRIVNEALHNIRKYVGELKETSTTAVGPGRILTHYLYYPSKNSRYLN